MKKILIVDDSILSRKFVKEALRILDDVVFLEAGDGVQALKVINEQDVDLVILDLIMPEKDGFDVLEELKTIDKILELPVIVHSSLDAIDSICKAFEMGAYDYFTKPLNAEQMQAIVPMKVKHALQSSEQKKTISLINERLVLEKLLANVFQQSLLSSQKDFSIASMFGRYIPSSDIGGVFYDCAQIGDDFWFVMAEVSAYGTSAAMMSSMIKMEFNDCIKKLTLPDMVLRHMNRVFFGITGGTYSFSAFVGLVNGNTMCYANGGHPFPVLFRHGSKNDVALLKQNDDKLGFSQDQRYNLANETVAAGDVLVLYNHGFLSQEGLDNQTEDYDEIRSHLSTYQKELVDNPAGFIDIVLRLYGNVNQDVISDDMSMMVICVK